MRDLIIQINKLPEELIDVIKTAYTLRKNRSKGIN